jgi:histidine ammonia-lyase
LRAKVPFYDKDRYFATDIAAANDLLVTACHNEMMPSGMMPSSI